MHLVVIGNGVAGITAALEVRRREPGWRITVVSKESKYHWSRPALMYVFLGHMSYRETKPFEDSYWDDRRIELLRDRATAVDPEKKTVALARGGSLSYDKLLLATGSEPNRFGWPGQDLDGVQGLYGLQDLHRLSENVRGTERAVIVGGGLIGVELAEMLHSHGIHVTFLVRESSYWNAVLPAEESALVNDVIRRAGIDLRLSTELGEIEDDGQGRAGAVVTNAGERISCRLVGLTAGVRPSVGFLRGGPVPLGRGILVDDYLRSPVADVFAAGDCAEIETKGEAPNRIDQVWYTGKMQGEAVAATICGDPCAYDPGIWFNSAKFFDLEYQVYGQVNRDLPGERSLYWEHPDRRRAIRIVHVDGAVVGFNVMGIRFRHEVCERWLRERANVDAVVRDLGRAGFDPELSPRLTEQMR